MKALLIYEANIYLRFRGIFSHVHEIDDSGVDDWRELEEKFAGLLAAVNTVDRPDGEGNGVQVLAALQIVNLQNVFDILEIKKNRF